MCCNGSMLNLGTDSLENHVMKMPIRPSTYVSLTSKFDYDTTVTRLVEALNEQNITLFVQIDQAAKAKEIGLSLRPTMLFLFGNPAAGTPIMDTNPSAALELPLRALVWRDAIGTVRLDFHDLARLMAEEYGVPNSLVAFSVPVAKMMHAVAGT
jgi:uncharacterized protein (DUF302 family)